MSKIHKTFLPATEENLTVATMVKNALNPYIYMRLCKLDENETIPDSWIDETEVGCKHILETSGIKVNPSISRQHVVNYILTERGHKAFGLQK